MRQVIEHYVEYDIFDVFVSEDPKLNPFVNRVQVIDKHEIKKLKRNPIKDILEADNFYYRRYE